MRTLLAVFLVTSILGCSRDRPDGEAEPAAAEPAAPAAEEAPVEADEVDDESARMTEEQLRAAEEQMEKLTEEQEQLQRQIDETAAAQEMADQEQKNRLQKLREQRDGRGKRRSKSSGGPADDPLGAVDDM